MDAVSYSLASKQAQRIEKFIENPDSNSGVLTQPKVIEAGETVTIPEGRMAVLPNLQIDGELVVDGDVFIPSGSTFSKVVETSGDQTIEDIKTFSSSPIVPTPTTDIQAMNLGTYNNGLGKQGYTHTADATFTGIDNKIVMTGIVTALGLEVGDVIIFSNANAANNKPHTVESITDNNTIIVNYEHCGNRGNGSLKLFDQTVTNANCKLLAKWFAAADGLGQDWVALCSKRILGTTYINNTNRTVRVLATSSLTASASLPVYPRIDVTVNNSINLKSCGYGAAGRGGASAFLTLDITVDGRYVITLASYYTVVERR